MDARQLMTRVVATISPEHSVWHAARLMLDKGVSGLPVIDEGMLRGIVTEGDLLRRTEIGTEEWPDSHLVDPARAFVMSRTWKVGDVMSSQVISVTEDTPVTQIAILLGIHRIKRLPVLRSTRLVGIVSRRDLLKIVAAGRPLGTVTGDDAIRRAIVARLTDAATVLSSQPKIVMVDGQVHVQGTVRSLAEREVVRLVVESVAGPGFVDNLTLTTPMAAEP